MKPKQISGLILLSLGLIMGGLLLLSQQEAKVISTEMVTVAQNKFLTMESGQDDIPIEKDDDLNTKTMVFKGLKEDDILGLVIIPSLNVKAPLTHGEDEAYLRYGVGLSQGTPGDIGNTVIGGHRNYKYSSYFKNLKNLRPDDTFEVITDSGRHRYRVFDVREVKPHEVWVMEDTEDSTATLITCTVDSKRRVVVFGKLVP